MPTIDRLIPDIYSLLQDKKNPLPGALGEALINNKDIFERFGKELGEVLFKSVSEEKAPSLRMSNIGRPLRQLYYEINQTVQPEPISGQSLFKFAYGHVLEALVLQLAETAGHTVERQQEEIEVDGVKGHIDAVIDGVLIDVKSASPYSYAKFKDGSLFTNDPFGYIGQLSGYANSLGLEAGYIAVNKVSGEMHFLKLPGEMIRAYDVRTRVKTVREAIAGSHEPERCYEDEPDGKSGNRKLGVSCSFCAFKSHCWRDANGGQGLRVYDYSNGTRYLTNVAREPRVNQEQFDIKE